MLAAFTLLGFYVCFNQIKALKIDVLSLKALLQDSQRFKAPGLAEQATVGSAGGGGGKGVGGVGGGGADGDGDGIAYPPQVFTRNQNGHDHGHGFENVDNPDAEDLQDAGLRDMLSDLVNAATSEEGVGGVTVFVGTGPDHAREGRDDTRAHEGGHYASEPREVVADIQDITDESLASGDIADFQEVDDAVDNLENLNVKDLKTLAAEKGIVVKAGIKKADIIALIRHAESSE
eukprot:jgi/Tetstr1/447208/TSEL_034645.t1